MPLKAKSFSLMVDLGQKVEKIRSMSSRNISEMKSKPTMPDKILHTKASENQNLKYKEKFK